MLTLLSAYMTTTGYVQSEDMRAALPLPLVAMMLALGVHLWPRQAGVGKVWPWCLPAYLLAGGPVFLLVSTWLHQH